jgi:hypothetical protein
LPDFNQREVNHNTFWTYFETCGLSLRIPQEWKNSTCAGILSYDENKLRCDEGSNFFEGT